MKKLTLLLLALACFAFSDTTRYLHVSTIPGNADIFVGNTAPDYGNKPNYTSPAFIPVESEEDHILIALFKPEFVDTIIDVSLSQKDTSYLIVSLKQSYDDDLLSKQEGLVSKRSRRSVGKIMMGSSIVPFVGSIVAASITQYQISKAEDAKKVLNNSKISVGDRYQDARDEFFDHKSSAKTAKAVTIGTIIGGAVLLSTGFILSF